ncbi:MAG TPA: TIM barrel protein [Candidatus Lokiarchaeia archaeon]|nr:TIM barrel protein [Candidatus Lokiarchaeia archaeon]
MQSALNTYSLRNEWDKIAKKNLNSLVAICKDMKISQVELLDKHFKKESLADDTKLLADNGITVFAIGPHVHLLVKPNEVEVNVSEGKAWLNLAHETGIKFIRFQVGDGPLPKAFQPMEDFSDEEWKEYDEQIKEAVDLTAAVIEPLIAEAEALGDVVISIETHHSYSSNFRYMKLVGERWKTNAYGWIFDIGNYENDYMRWEALDVIKSNTAYIHAKAYDFDGAGFEKTLDYPKACQILHDAGFDGNWSIEFEGKMNGIIGALKTNELVKHSIAAATGESYTMKTTFPSDKDLLKKYKQ